MEVIIDEKEIAELAILRTGSKDELSSRKRRRAAIKTIATQMEEVLAEEERYRDNVPENLLGAKWHEASESSINLMQEIIDLMADIYG